MTCIRVCEYLYLMLKTFAQIVLESFSTKSFNNLSTYVENIFNNLNMHCVQNICAQNNGEGYIARVRALPIAFLPIPKSFKKFAHQKCTPCRLGHRVHLFIKERLKIPPQRYFSFTSTETLPFSKCHFFSSFAPSSAFTEGHCVVASTSVESLSPEVAYNFHASLSM